MIPLDSSTEALALRAAFDQQIRSRLGSTNGGTVERVGPLIRKAGFEGDGFILYPDLGGLDGAALDELIGQQVSYFEGIGRKFEWKYYSHDLPADLPERLVKAGFVPDEEECLLIGDVGELVSDVVLPDGVRLREITSRADLERMQAQPRGRTRFPLSPGRRLARQPRDSRPPRTAPGRRHRALHLAPES